MLRTDAWELNVVTADFGRNVICEKVAPENLFTVKPNVAIDPEPVFSESVFETAIA